MSDETSISSEIARVRLAITDILKNEEPGSQYVLPLRVFPFSWFFEQPNGRGGHDHPLKRFGINQPTPDHNRIILEFLNELLRNGVIAWGNPANPNESGKSYVFLTDQGGESLKSYDRDPRNPNGYLAHLKSIGELDEAELSFAEEAAWSFTAGRHRAAAVMIGVAAESLILRLAEDLNGKLGAKSPFGKELEQGRIKGVLDQLAKFFRDEQAPLKAAERKLGERLNGGLWGSLTETIRISRNAAGHPESLTAIDEGKAWTSLVLFPDLTALVRDVRKWAGLL